MSIFFILSIAAMTLPAFLGSLSASISLRMVGVICHDRPYLSLSQPHTLSSPPSESFFPEHVHFFLRLAADSKRDGLCEFELGTTVQRYKFLSIDLELHGHHSPRGPLVNLISLFSITRDFSNI